MAHQAMTQQTQLSDKEFDHHVMEILARELGPGDFARFLMLHRSGQGDYTRDRHLWLDETAVSEIMREAEIQAGVHNQ